MQTLKLGKKWNKHPKGATVTVDSGRAEWLIRNDFVGDVEAILASAEAMLMAKKRGSSKSPPRKAPR